MMRGGRERRHAAGSLAGRNRARHVAERVVFVQRRGPMQMTHKRVFARVGWIVGTLACALAGEATAQQPTEIIVRNGTIVNATGRTQGDVRIRNGTIAEIGSNLTA